MSNRAAEPAASACCSAQDLGRSCFDSGVGTADTRSTHHPLVIEGQIAIDGLPIPVNDCLGRFEDLKTLSSR